MNSNLFFYENLSFCIYIGNTSSINEDILLNYCSRFGTIRRVFSISKELFCDFHIIEYVNDEQVQRFLHHNNHQINQIRLDVQLYKYILTHHDILNIDRKFYIGPIRKNQDENKIIEFYRTIDPTLRYYSLKQNEHIYLLFELNNRQLVTRIFERQRIPSVHEYRKLILYKPIHPKEFRHRIISMKNRFNQIHIHGLTSRISEAILIEYFHKHAPVIACHILTNGSRSAILEFNDRKTVEKILELRSICLEGTNFLLSEAKQNLASLIFLSDNQDNIEDQKKILSLEQNSSQLPSIDQYSSIPCLTTDSGWSSPPRSIVLENRSIDRTINSIELNNNTTMNDNHIEPMNQLTTMDIDIKPHENHNSSNNLLEFTKQIENELEQIRNEYRLKFQQDQINIEQEINLLIREEQQTLEKLNHYLIDQRQRTNDRYHNTYYKRKYSPR